MSRKVMILIVVVGAMAGGSNSGTVLAGPSPVGDTWLFGAPESEAFADWVTVNDTVMGGVSDGWFRVDEVGNVVFYGKLSLENNGGFASIRSRGPVLNLDGYNGLRLWVRGDGRRYSLSVQTDFPIMAGAYYADFETSEGKWTEITVSFDEFEPRSFGQPLAAAPPLNTRQIQSMGFILADKQEGSFELTVDSIVAERKPSAATNQDAPESQTLTAARLISTAISRGVPLFNGGQVEACAAVYEMTCLCLTVVPPGDLPESVRNALEASLEQAEPESDPVRKAWILRHGLDAAYEGLMYGGNAVSDRR